MSDVAELFDRLRAAGFTLTARNGKLIVSPASKLAPEQTKAIQEHKAGLLALLDLERPLSPLEKFIAGHRPEASVKVLIELPGGQYRAVSAQDYVAAIGGTP